jgi:hypothetical protein
MMWWTIWCVWMAAALVMAIVEVVVPAYIFMGFAIGAALTGVALVVGLFAAASLSAVLVGFAGWALLGYVGMRLAFGAPGGSVKKWDTDIND